MLQLFGLRRAAASDTKYKLKPERRLEQPLVYETKRIPDVTRLEALDLGFDAVLLHADRELVQKCRRVDEDAFAEVERAAVEGSDLRSQADRRHPLLISRRAGSATGAHVDHDL